MQARDYLTEARRWSKFPATVLLVTGLLWLLQSYFELNWTVVQQQSESVIGALNVFAYMVIVPLGSVAAGLGMLFLQRWALYSGFVLPALTLLYLTYDKWLRITQKFAEFRLTGDVASFGGGVMTTLLLVALWAVYVLIISYLLRSLHQLDLAQGWLSHTSPARQRSGSVDGDRSPAQSGSTTPQDSGAEDEYCMFLPDEQADEAE
jgi:hypothetical protein